jgi:MFS family permease
VDGAFGSFDAASQVDATKNDAPWLEELQREFGWQLMSTIMVAQHMFKGFVNTLLRSNWYYIVKQYSVPATRVSIYEGVVYLPWALKPMIGFISDFFTIGGYAKLPYLLFSAVLGTGSLAILGYYQRSLAIGSIVGLLFYVSLAQSTTDLLIEAVYARSMREKPQYAPSLTSFVWGGMVVAGMIATLISGVFLSYGSPWTLYSVSMWPCAFLLIPILQNWIGEVPMTDSQVQTQRNNIMKQSEALALCLIILCSCIILSYSGLMLSVKMNAFVSIMVLMLVLTSFSLLLNPIIAKVNAFGMIQTAMNVSLGSAAFFFMLDSPKEYPQAPLLRCHRARCCQWLEVFSQSSASGRITCTQGTGVTRRCSSLAT